MRQTGLTATVLGITVLLVKSSNEQCGTSHRSCSATPDSEQGRPIDSKSACTVQRVTKAQISYPTGDSSFAVMESWPTDQLPAAEISPFLLNHDWGSPTKTLGKPAVDPGAPPVAGEPHVGWHPHRGFDLLSYIKEGRGRHADSIGNRAVVRPGGLQWMRAGSGIEHAEGGGNPDGAAKHGFQIW